ncbi:SRPBCC family protein [Sphingosinithalassobacter portus]|uniref:SRPBCC family protein n=1 Tax=Stakelama portus TaxID=2676234 RepID=UPI000D6DDBB8|nr:SRPBCC domain-containing protein [Sphingosinithalassobacter portus]
MSPADTDCVVITRHFAHPPEQVFAAFASAEAISRWLAPHDSIALIVEVFQFATEGAYRFCYAIPDAGELHLEGRFLTIDRPRRLSFSWCWLPPDIHAGIESLVEIDFAPTPKGTQLSLRHSRLDEAQMAERHSQGWAGALGRLERLLETGSQGAPA